MPTVLITGSTGFVGSYLVNSLLECSDLVIKIAVRQSVDMNGPICFEVGDINPLTDFSSAVTKTDVVIHLAARAHVMNNSSVDPLSEFRAVNTGGTLNLARQAAKAGVKRFIFLSSIGVNGVNNTVPFSVYDSPAPVEDYAVSKFEAEVGLRRIATETGMEVVIIRPPLVYGSNAPGNFGKLARLTSKNIPLPFGAINNKRSLISLDNLVDLIVTCIDHPKAANQTFLVSDDYDVSTTKLLSLMALAAGKKPRLIPVPVSVLRLIGRFTGKLAVLDRLCGNLQVDISHTKKTLGWNPPVSFQNGIQKCFCKEQKDD
ncbi:epimerase [Marinomonas ushuaiensis DSM 15871]|uniref:Epimerase n=1 Tax=Marinomonas ushuaiensis DSM 15871 TaxID=1122207 RepID=X7E925_9GAMM|nr:SDR family oxidoreductase [Marinomonas ushuaiensis]ETX12589.1 epimerase [Marinomonas ushuaiensis DSM 15871]